MEQWEIWDMHTHMLGVPGQTPAERLGWLIKYADRMGIARLCVFLGMESDKGDPTPEQLRLANDQVLEAIRPWSHRAFGFVYLNPKHRQASLDELNRCVRDGPMVGVKLWIAMHCNAPELDPILERAVELKAIIYQHTWLKYGEGAPAYRHAAGNGPGESTPWDVAELAVRHPNVPIACVHSGGDWERGFRAIRACPNVYAEIAGGDPTAGLTEMAVAELGAERVLYGSDAGGRSYASQLAKVLGANISDSAKRLILAGNIKRLLQPILQQKGIKV